MPKNAKAKTKNSPQPSRPHMPGYGIARVEKGILPWSWAERRLLRGWNYFIATTRPDSRPHLMPVWGVWFEGAFYFSTGGRSRKARNLRKNPNCVITPEDGHHAVLLEGVARRVNNPALIKRVGVDYKKKYKYALDPKGDPVFAVRPRRAFAFKEDKTFLTSATRWIFD